MHYPWICTFCFIIIFGIYTLYLYEIMLKKHDTQCIYLTKHDINKTVKQRELGLITVPFFGNSRNSI